MRPQAEAWPLRATLLGGHPCGPAWLPRLAGGHGGEARPWVPISSPCSAPSPRTLCQPGGICVLRAQAVLPVPQFPLCSTPGGGWRGCPSTRELEEQRGPRGTSLDGVFGGLFGVLGWEHPQFSPWVGACWGGCIDARGQRDTGWGRVCKGTRSWEVTARQGTRLVREAERKAKKGPGMGTGTGRAVTSPRGGHRGPQSAQGGGRERGSPRCVLHSWHYSPFFLLLLHPGTRSQTSPFMARRLGQRGG